MTVTVFFPEAAQITPDELSKRLSRADSGIHWVDITGPTDDDVRLMHDVFHFHPLAIEDTRNMRQRPKVEEYADYLFLILNPVGMQQDDTLFCELDVFVGSNYVVTVHKAAEPVIDEVQRRIERGAAVLPMTASYLLYLLIDAVVDSYFPVLDTLEESIEELGDRVLTNPDHSLLNRLFVLKKTLVDMWRVVWPQREMINSLRSQNPKLFDYETLQHYMRDVFDHLMWIADMVSTFRDTLTGTMDLYMSAVSNRLNKVVNRLTVITVIIGVMTVIGGFYGMNFEHTWPPFSSSLGVPFVLFLMGGAMVALLVTFKRLKYY
ncbi:MAG: magnesium/cobalt transporter CorA [Chloroflexi bacterium]|nr:magnesium/cobalt transporter CorA [Chloroflexota bacterium]